jgi:hypothetical protein
MFTGAREQTVRASVFNGGFNCFDFDCLEAETPRSNDPMANMPDVDVDWTTLMQRKLVIYADGGGEDITVCAAFVLRRLSPASCGNLFL